MFISNIFNSQISVEIFSLGGALATVVLIIISSVALLLVDSKYWDRWSSSTLDIISYPLLIVFASIVIFKIWLVL